MFLRTALYLAALAGLAFANVVEAQPYPAPPEPPVMSDIYRLGVNDEIQVVVFGPQNVEVKTRIRDDGTIAFPYLSTVMAAGETTRSLADAIATRLRSGGYYVSPTVKVDVVSFVSNAVTVSGNVAAPGIFPLDRTMTIAMVVARAGGTKNEAAEYALLTRKGEPIPRRILLTDVTDAAGGANLVLMAGDTIIVPPAPVIYVYGQVNAPGAFGLRPGMTVEQALARAGGPTLAGSARRISIKRGTVTIKRAKLDDPVEPGDTLFIPEKIF